MESIRQSKVARVLQKELAEIFRSESKNMFNGAFISVTVVRVSPDLSLAKTYLSILTPADKKKTLELVEKQKGGIKRLLGAKVRFQLKIMPDLQFFIDDSIDYAGRIDELLK